MLKDKYKDEIDKLKFYDSESTLVLLKQLITRALKTHNSYKSDQDLLSLKLTPKTCKTAFALCDKIQFFKTYDDHLKQNARFGHPDDHTQIYTFLLKCDQKLKYVIDTIEKQDSEKMHFSVKEIIDQTVQLAVIEMKQQSQENQQQSKKVCEATKLEIPKVQSQSKPQVFDKSTNSHALREIKQYNDFPLQVKPQPPVQLKTYCSLRNRPSSAASNHQKGIVNFMSKQVNHVERNVARSKNREDVSSLMDAQFATNDRPMQLKLPKYPQKSANYGPKQIEDDENVDFLINNLNPNKTMNAKLSLEKPEDYFAKQNVYRRQMNLTQNNLIPFPRKQQVKQKLYHNSIDYDFVPEKENSDRNNQPHIENDFKLLIKFMKLWKLFMKIQKQKRKQKKFDMEMLIKAIEFHECKLCRKTIKSFRKTKIKQLKLNHAQYQVQEIVIANLKVFYFKQIRRKYVREQKRKYFKTIASSYFQEQRKYKCLLYWGQIAKKANQQAQTIFQQIQQRCPYAAEILFTISHDFYLGQSQNNGILDVVSFQFFALNQFSNNNGKVLSSQLRVRKHQLARFNESVEFILFKKQERCYKYWLRFLWMHKSFRRRVKLNFKMKFFKILKTKMVTKKTLQAKFIVLQQIQQKQKECKYFEEWISLHQYYSKFTQSTYCYTQKKISEMHFKKKYFDILKQYLRTRQIHNKNVQIADSKFFNRYVRFCFQNWAWFKCQQRRIKFAKSDLSKNYTFKEKAKYFKALQRAFAIETSLKALRKRHMTQRVFASFEKRKQYKALRSQILQICLSKFDISIQRRALVSLKTFIKTKTQLRSLQSLIETKVKSRVYQKVIAGLKQNLVQKNEKKNKNDFMDQLHQINLMRKVLKCLQLRSLFQKDLKLKHHILLSTRNEKKQQLMFRAMHQRYNKRISDKALGRRLKEKTSKSVRIGLMNKWVRKFRHLKECEQILKAKSQRVAYSDIFKLWRIKMLLMKQYRFKKKCFDEKIRMRYLKLFFGAFTDRARYKIRSSNMKQVSSFFFLKNKIGRCMQSLKRYTRYRKIKRTTANKHQSNQQESCFEELKKLWWRSSQLKVFVASKMFLTQQQAYKAMAENALRKIELKKKKESIMLSRSMKLKDAVFKILVCPEMYICSDAVIYDHHEVWKLKNSFSALKEVTIFQKKLRDTGEVAKKMSNRLMIKQTFDIWMSEMYLKELTNNVAEPHLANVVNKSLKTQVFRILNSNLQYQRKKKYVAETYNESLITKGLESMRWYANSQIHHRGLIEYMTIKRSKFYLQEVFVELKSYIHVQSLLKSKAQAVKAKSVSYIVYKLFKAWKQEAVELQLLEPASNYLDKQYSKNLMQKAFSALYKNRSFKIIKKNMTAQADKYCRQLMKRRVFENLAWYSLIHKRNKNEMRDIANHQFKRIIINRWIGVLNNVQKIKDDVHISGALSSGGNLNSVKKEGRSSIGSITGDLGFFGDTDDKRSQDSIIHAVNTAKFPYRSMIPPRPQKILNTNSSQDNIERSSVQSLNIQELNTSEELNAAHDMMSKHLKNMLQQNQDGKEVEILKNLISEIKHKYQLSRMVLQDPQINIQENMTPVEALSEFDQTLIDSPKKLRREMAMTKYKGDLIKKAFMGLQINVDDEDEIQNIQAKSFRTIQLKIITLRSFNQYVQTTKSLRAIENYLISRHEMSLQRRVINGLSWYIEYKAQKNMKFAMSLSHYIQRQYRLGLFAFKKHQLMNIMQHSIQSQVLNRMKQKHFQAWLRFSRQNVYDYNSNQVPLQMSDQKTISKFNTPLDSLNDPSQNSNIKIQEHEPVTINSNSSESDNGNFELQKQDSLGFNNTNGTKFSQLEDLAQQLDFNDNPQPFQGFTDNEDNDNEIQDQNRESKFVDNSLEDSLEQLFSIQEFQERIEGSSFENMNTKGDTKITGQLIGSDFAANKLLLDTQQINAPSETESDF